MTRNKMVFADKVPFVTPTGRDRLLDSVEIVRLARGISHEQLLQEPSAHTVINTNSPRKLDSPMAMGIIEMARLNQIVMVTPFTLMGAMAPVSLAGAIVEQNAEALAGLALSQLTRPGAPFIYGGFTSNVDMKCGRARFRNAGVHEGLHHRRPAGTPLQASLSHLQHQRGERGRRAGGV